jgi:hypothetical protein
MKKVISLLPFLFIFCSNPTTAPDSVNNAVKISDIIGYWYQTKTITTEYDSNGIVTNYDPYSYFYIQNNILRTIVMFTADSIVHFINYDSTKYTRSSEEYSIFHGYYYDGKFDSTSNKLMEYFREYAGKDDDLMEIQITKGKSLVLKYHEYYNPIPPGKKYSEKLEYVYEWLDSSYLPKNWPNELVTCP